MLHRPFYWRIVDKIVRFYGSSWAVSTSGPNAGVIVVSDYFIFTYVVLKLAIVGEKGKLISNLPTVKIFCEEYCKPRSQLA